MRRTDLCRQGCNTFLDATGSNGCRPDIKFLKSFHQGPEDQRITLFLYIFRAGVPAVLAVFFCLTNCFIRLVAIDELVAFIEYQVDCESAGFGDAF